MSGNGAGPISSSLEMLASVDAGFRAVLEEAERRGIAVRPLGTLGIVVLGEGCRAIRLCGGITGRTSHLAVRLAANKMAAKHVLGEAGIPTPQGQAFTDMVSARAYFRAIEKPVVIKPVAGNMGRGVCTGITDEAAFITAWREATRISRRVIVEAMARGRDFRILVIGGRVVAASERVPPSVTGDGASGIAELIDAINGAPERGLSHEKHMTRICLDAELQHCIGQAGYTLDSVLEKDQHLVLRHAANMSRGAHAIDRTDALHPSIAALAVQAAETIGLDIAGVDIIADNIGCFWREAGVQVIEVNATPGLRMHIFPREGRSQPVHEAVLDYLFP